MGECEEWPQAQEEAAKRAALDALAKAQTKPLDQLFERELVRQPGGNGLEELLNSPDMTPEQRQQIQKLMEQQRQLQQQRTNKHGSRETHEVDVPVGWAADAGHELEE